jgi:CDP-diacylglycerol--serine O-phosphatidyltransferase
MALKLKPNLEQLRRAQKLKPRHMSINKLIPNMMTTLALCCGLTAIRFAIEIKWELAVVAIIFAVILDNLDGRIARLIGGTSGFGAQLDSLADVVSFGVVPALIMYFWTLEALGRLGWAASLLFVVCAAIRLARFNMQITDPDLPDYAKNYFSGVPTPVAAGLALTPLILSFQFGDDALRHPSAIALWMILIAGMMVSKFPTYSFKKVKVPHGEVPLMLVGVGVIAACLFAEPWMTLSVMALIYIGLLPFSYRNYYRLKAEQEAKSEDNLFLFNGTNPDDQKPI